MSEVWKFDSKYSESSIRRVFLSHDRDVDDQIRVIVQTNETSSLEILEFTEDNGRLCGRTWCPQESRMEDEYDFMQITSCLYSRRFVCVGFSNGSVRMYSFPSSKSKVSTSSDLNEDSQDGIDDQYYNAMFGGSQETEKDKVCGRFWLDDPEIRDMPSRLLMKHMGYPVCIREQNGMIYVLYDDGALMSTRVESEKRGYNVIRYDETFQGGIYFSVSPRGDKIAVSNSNRKLQVCSLEARESTEERDDGIRSCKLLFEVPVFKKSSFQQSKKSKVPYNSLVFEWSSCGDYIYIPGEPDVRVISVSSSQRDVRYFRSESTSKGYGLDICLVKAINYDEDRRILVSVSLQGEVKVYLLGQEPHDIREIGAFMLRDKSMKESYPVSLDLIMVPHKDSDSRLGGIYGVSGDSLCISSLLNSGELILNKIQVDLNSYSRVHLGERRGSGVESDEVLGHDLASLGEEKGSKTLKKGSSQDLIWDEPEVEVEVEDDEEVSVPGKSGRRRGRKVKSTDKRGRSGSRRLDDEDAEDKFGGGEESEPEPELELEPELEFSEMDGGSDSELGSGAGGLDRDVDLDLGVDDGDEDEYEYEYESWDKREFGRHIEHLKGRIERLKAQINSGNESQPVVCPGFTGDSEALDSLNEENREFLFCWNQSGYISYSIDDSGRPCIDMECYSSIDGPKKLRVYDTKGYSMACIGMDGYLLGRKSKILENGTVIPSVVDYNIWRTWGRSDKSGWSKTLLGGEDLVCMTCNRDLVAVVTSLRYLRVWRNSGISVSVTKLVGSPVSCVSNESYLLVVSQREPFYPPRARSRVEGGLQEGIVSGRCNTYEVTFLDVGQEVLIYSGTMSVSPETTIKWCGISNKGVPVIQDTSGQTFMLSRQWKNQRETWVPLTNFGLLESSVSCKYFILGINDDHFNVLKLPDGLDHPIPMMAKSGSSSGYSTIKIPFNIPILGLPPIRQWMNVIENDPTLNECITNNSISWEVIDELRIKLDLMQSNISMVDEFSSHKDSNQYKQYKLQREKLLMRLYMKLVIRQLVEPAFDVVRMFNFPKSFQIALEQAEKAGERILANKISQEIQMRSRYEQDKSLKHDDRGGHSARPADTTGHVPLNEQPPELLQNKSDLENRHANDNDRPSDLSCKNTDHTTVKSKDSTKPFVHSIHLNNTFNTRTNSGVEREPALRSLTEETNSEITSQHAEICKTIQYCSDIIKRRKM
ncbi:WD40 repeat protein [Cryptosporidium canis]|uniref:WD40 repeat protein n=1 Tax=Cryptosporidium canis TaxID=195482 RepID=A0ABQ8P890_9CRYT|nr:WD40 repeat protein [Cryptosporidium canis]